MAWLVLSLRRLRDARATSVALALTVLVTAFVFAVAPRLVETAATGTLHDELRRAPSASRNVQLLQDSLIEPASGDDPLATVRERGHEQELRFPASVARLVAERSLVVDTPRWLVSSRPLSEATVKLRLQPAAVNGIRVTSGRLPTAARRELTVSDPPPLPAGEFDVTALEVALSTATAEVLGVVAGDTLVLRLDPTDRITIGHDTRLALDIVGIFDVAEPAADGWFDDSALERITARSPGPLVVIQDATVMLGPDAYPSLHAAVRPTQLPLRYTWRFELDEERVDAPSLPALLEDTRRMESVFPRGGTLVLNDEPILRTGLLRILQEQQARWRSAETMLTVVSVGPAVVALAALALVAALAGARRRGSLLLARGRGASIRQLVSSLGAEAALLAGPAVALAVLGAFAVVATGPAVATTALAVAVGAAAGLFLVAATLPAALRAGRPAPDGSGATRPRARRLVIEVLLVGLAIVGIVLLRDRGVSGASTAEDLATGDPLIAAVPALAGFAAAIVVMRMFPIPLRLLAEVVAAGRGLVPALGIRRAVRGGGTAIVLVVLLAAAGLGAFASATLVHVTRAGEAIAWHAVGAAYRVTSSTGPLPATLDPGEGGPPLPGADAAAAAWTGPGAIDGKTTRITVVALDLPAYATVTGGTPADLALPPELLAALAGPAAGTPLPAVVSPAVTAANGRPYAVGDEILITVAGAEVRLRVVALGDRAPAVPGDQFAIVSREHLGAAVPARDLRPTRLFLRAPDSAAATLRTSLAEVAPALVLASRAEGTFAILEAPAVIALRAGITLAALVAAAYAALAVVAALTLAGAARAGEIAHLRTLGLTRRQAIWLMLVEQGPAVVVAFVGGVALGVGLFVVLRPGLGLDGLLGAAVEVPLAVDPFHLVVLLAAMAGVVALGIALGAAAQGGSRIALALRKGIE